MSATETTQETVTVISHWEGRAWQGELPVPVGLEDEKALNVIFRLTNVVDEEDSIRLAKLGHAQPSTSVDDTIVFRGQAWDVASIGFVKQELVRL